MPKVRIDVLLQQRGLAESREQAQRLVAAGRVSLGTTTFVKASQTVSDDAELVVSEPERYVSRGGLKLEGAIEAFGIACQGRVCLDLGASTGGFTDCLLQHGAAGVIAVDVGRAQLHQRLREDPRVTLLEGVNARALPQLEFTIHKAGVATDSQSVTGTFRPIDGGAGERTANDELRTTVGGTDEVGSHTNRESRIVNRESITLFVADLSFISLRKVLPSVAGRLAGGTEGIVLLKPQFEAGRKDVPRGGVIKDEGVVERVRSEFVSWLEGNGWHVYGMIRSPIRGGDGNVEWLVHLRTPA